MKRAMLISAMSLLDFSLTGASSLSYRENFCIFLPDASYVKPKYITDDRELFRFVYKQPKRTYFAKNINKEKRSSKFTFSPPPYILADEKNGRRTVINRGNFSFRKNTPLYHPVSFKGRVFRLKIPP